MVSRRTTTRARPPETNTTGGRSTGCSSKPSRTVGTRDRRGEHVAHDEVGGKACARPRTSPDSQCLPTTRATRGRRRGREAGTPRIRCRREPAGVVGHAAVDGHVGAQAGEPLYRSDPVQRHGRGWRRRPSRLGGETNIRPQTGRRSGRCTATRPVGDRGRRLPLDVGDAEAAADAALLEAVRDHERCKRRAISSAKARARRSGFRCGHAHRRARSRQAPSCRDSFGRPPPRPGRIRTSSPLARSSHIRACAPRCLVSRGREGAPSSRRAGRLAPTRQLQAADLVERVDDDPADTGAERGRQLFRRLVVAVARRGAHRSPLPPARRRARPRSRRRAPFPPRWRAPPSPCTRRPLSRTRLRAEAGDRLAAALRAAAARRRRRPACRTPRRARGGRARRCQGDRRR